MKIIKKPNKKALSTIVVAVIMITLCIAAIALVYTFVQTTIKDALMSPAVSCIDYQTNPPASLEKICYDSTAGDLNIKVQKRLGQSEINSLDFIVNSEGKSEQFCCGQDCPNCEILKEGEKIYYVAIETKPKSVGIIIDKCALDVQPVQDC